MTPDEFRDVMARLGLSHRQMAERTGLHRNSVNAYASGRSEIPRYVALACAALLAGLPEAGSTKGEQ